MQRAYHRPIKIKVESIIRMPDVRDLPQETQMTVNLQFNRKSRREMILFLIKEELADEPLEFTFVTITGPS